MNVVGLGLGGASVFGMAAAVAALMVPRPGRPAVVGTLTSVAGALGVMAGVAALLGQAWTMRLPGVLPLSGVLLTVDALGGVFLVVSGVVGAVAATYGIGYSRRGLDGRGAQAVLPLFVLSLLLVPAAGSVATFLVCWELMALTSLLLGPFPIL